MTTINISDLIDVHHGDALLEVDAKRVKVKGNAGYRGIVKVKFPKTPQANYVVAVEGDSLRLDDVDATADAILLRKDIIAQNKVKTATQREVDVAYERSESNAAYKRIQRQEDGYRE
jgi:hypothetical protein